MSDTHRVITHTELEKALSGESPPIMIDVRSKEAYERSHIPGSGQNCVLEVGFEDRFREDHPDPDISVCVYGDCPDSHEARMAAEKLLRTGCRNVLELREGIDAWQKANLPLDGSREKCAPDASKPLNGTYPIDLGESRIEWIGRNLLNRHHGLIGIKSGELHFEEGVLQGGAFTINMDDIRCSNLSGDPLHDVLVNHLRSHDFFDTEFHPEANYTIDSVQSVPEAPSGSPNLEIQGTLTVKGRRNSVSFPAVSGVTPDGAFAAQATVSVDRTLWGVIYGSGKYFRNLGMHLVNDLIELQLRVLTSNSEPN